MKGISKFTAAAIKEWDCDAKIDGKWTPARPIGMGGVKRRFKMAWLVFTGKADVLTWHKQ